jgi:hypothetical protein
MDRKFELQLLIEHLNQERQAMFRRTRCPDVEHYLGPQVPPRPDYVLEDIKTGKEIAVERTSVFLRHEYQKYDVGWAGVREDLERNLNGTLPGLFLLLLPIKINYKQQSKHQLIDALKREIAKTSIKLAGVGQSVVITVSVNGLSPLYATLKKVNEHPSRIFVFPEKFRWFTPAPAQHLAEILKKGFQHADTKFIGWES